MWFWFLFMIAFATIATLAAKAKVSRWFVFTKHACDGVFNSPAATPEQLANARRDYKIIAEKARAFKNWEDLNQDSERFLYLISTPLRNWADLCLVYADSAYKLGVMCAKGMGGDVDRKAAEYWFSRAITIYSNYTHGHGFYPPTHALASYAAACLLSDSTASTSATTTLYGNAAESFLWINDWVALNKSPGGTQDCIHQLINRFSSKSYSSLLSMAESGDAQAMFVLGSILSGDPRFKLTEMPSREGIKGSEWLKAAADTLFRQSFNATERQKHALYEFDLKNEELLEVAVKLNAKNKVMPAEAKEKGLYFRIDDSSDVSKLESGVKEVCAQMYYMLYEKAENNPEKMHSYLTEAAKYGHPQALFELGMLNYSQMKYSEAEAWLTQAADQGSTTALYLLGEIVEKRDRNSSKAAVFYQEATELGDCYAQYALAQYMQKNYRGRTAEQQKQVKTLYAQAAEQKHIGASTALADYYFYDLGAAYEEHQQAHALYEWLLKEEYVTDQRLDWPSPTSRIAYQLGVMNAKGMGVAQNSERAERWFKQALENVEANGTDSFEQTAPLYFALSNLHEIAPIKKGALKRAVTGYAHIAQMYVEQLEQSGLRQSLESGSDLMLQRRAEQGDIEAAYELTLRFMKSKGERTVQELQRVVSDLKTSAKNTVEATGVPLISLEKVFDYEASALLRDNKIDSKIEEPRQELKPSTKPVAPTIEVTAIQNSETTENDSEVTLEEVLKEDEIKVVESKSDFDTLNSRVKTKEELIELGVEELTVLAEVGRMDAQLLLAERYQRGQGVMVDYKQVAYWLEKAVAAGSSQAMYELAQLHLGAQIGAIDHEKAAKLLSQAMESWLPEFKVRQSDSFAVDEYESFEALEKSAQSGDAKACYTLGMHYINEQTRLGAQADKGAAHGRAVREAERAARVNLEKAAQREHAGALYEIAERSLKGEGLRQDFRKSVQSYQQLIRMIRPAGVFEYKS